MCGYSHFLEEKIMWDCKARTLKRPGMLPFLATKPLQFAALGKNNQMVGYWPGINSAAINTLIPGSRNTNVETFGVYEYPFI